MPDVRERGNGWHWPRPGVNDAPPNERASIDDDGFEVCSCCGETTGSSAISICGRCVAEADDFGELPS